MVHWCNWLSGYSDGMNGSVVEKYGGKSSRRENDQIENLRATCENRGWSCHIKSCHTNPEVMSELLWPIKKYSLCPLTIQHSFQLSFLNCAIGNIHVTSVKDSTMTSLKAG